MTAPAQECIQARVRKDLFEAITEVVARSSGAASMEEICRLSFQRLAPIFGDSSTAVLRADGCDEPRLVFSRGLSRTVRANIQRAAPEVDAEVREWPLRVHDLASSRWGRRLLAARPEAGGLVSPEAKGLVSMLAWPIAWAEKSMGWLLFFFSSPELITEEVLSLGGVVAGSLALGMICEDGARRRDSEARRQRALRALLEVSLGDTSVPDFLAAALDLVLDIPDLPLEGRGAIFLADPGTGDLRLTAHRNLSPGVIEMCARVPSGRCLCGTALATGELQFAAHMDERHQNHCPEMTPHGHYTVPIKNGEGILGVLNVYLKAGYRRLEEDDAFLVSVVQVLASSLVRRRAEEERARADHSFRALVRHAPLAVVVIRDGRILYVNPTLVHLLGYDDPSEIVGREYGDFVPEGDRARIGQRIAKVLRTQQREPLQERRFLRKDGSIVVVEAGAMLLDFMGGPAVVAVGHDVTERRKFATKLMQMDRMIAVGTLAAGVGHEINNPLTYVSANIDFAVAQIESLPLPHRGPDGAGGRDPTKGEAAASSELEAELSEILDALREARLGARRIQDVIQDLRSLARATTEDRDPVDLVQSLRSAASISSNEIRHRARLVDELGPVPLIMGNESKLSQVFVNLLVNAAQAIELGHAQENEIHVRTFVAEGQVVVEVADTGAGIPAADLDRVFDAFFTTKPVGQGTGLGLAICREIVTAHHGEIEVESRVGLGTTFRLRFPPAREETMMSHSDDPSTPAPREARRARVLVVDDEPMIGRLVDRLLRSFHDVVAVTSGREALERIEHEERFDAILCDLMMPEMSGMDLYAEIAERRPDLLDRIAFMTGGTFVPEAKAFTDRVPNPCIFKPLDLEGLKKLVAELAG